MNKKRLGLIVPSSNTIIEPDLCRGLAGAASLHSARMYLRDTTVAGESQMLDVYFPAALRDLASARPEAIIFGCTSAGALRGNDWDGELCRRIQTEADCPAISVVASARQVLTEARCRRIAILTPYVAELGQRIQASFAADGFEVALLQNLGIESNFAISQVDPAAIAAYVRQALTGVSVDGLFISCTNFRAMEALPLIRRFMDIPVFTSNQAALLQAQRVLGLAAEF